MGGIPALRDICASNAAHKAQRATCWPGAELALIESRPREPVSLVTLRPPGALLLLHAEGGNSRVAIRYDGEAPVTGGTTLGKLGLIPEGRLTELSADLPSPSLHMALLLAPELFHAEAEGRSERIELRPSVDLADPVLLGQARELRAELEAPGPLGRLYLESLAAGIAVRLARAHSTSPSAPARTPVRGGLPPRRLRLVREHVEANLADEVALADLAAVAGLSPSHFCRAFRQSTGLSPHQYLIQRRLEQAKELLAESQLPIAEVALAAGFASQSHLNAHFVRALGTTPRRFRDSI